MKKILCSLAIIFCSTSSNAEIVGVGNFSHITSDLDRSMAFYGGVLGLTPITPKTEFSDNPAIMQIGNTPGAQSRIATFSIPGSDMGVELVEYKDIRRQAIQTRFQDPGAALLQIRVRDMNGILDRIENSAAFIWTPSGVPVNFAENARIIFLKDPDGFFVEIIEMPAPAGSVSDNIYSANFEVMITDTINTAKFFQSGLGIALQVGNGFDATPELGITVNAPGGAFRRSTAKIPNSNVTMNFLEFKDINRKPMNSNIQDPGTAILQLFSDDVEATTNDLVEAGGTVISTGGKPIDMGGQRYISITRDLNNLFIELLPAAPAR